MTLSAFAWNIVRTYTLTPGRRYSFGCRYRLGTARGPHGGQPPGIADAAGQPAVPSQPHEGSLGALPLPLRPRGYLRVRNIDIGRVGYLRHSFIAGFPTERVPKMPLSGVSTHSGDLARFNLKGLDGTMTDLFIHLVAYQLVTLSGTGVSVLD